MEAPAAPSCPYVEEMLMMLPLPCPCMTRTACFMLRITPSTFVSNVAATLSAVCSVIGPTWPSVPALLTATSRRPNRATVLSTRLLTSSSRRTSAWTKSASAPKRRNSASRALPSASRRPETTRRAPSLAKARAVARPMPVRAPVIRTTRLPMVLLLPAVVPNDPLGMDARIQFEFRFRPRLCKLGTHTSQAWGTGMELRHLRYFVAVAEEGSVTVAAERRLHTSQPSLSRQLRDLEYEVGAQLLTRGARGVELTAAGRAFLDHARLVLAQVDAAGEAARRAAQPARKTFAIGFQTGHEMNWLSEAMHVLRDELHHIEVTISSNYSPDLADALARGRLDVAFLRVEPHFDLEYRVVTQEPLVVLMPSDHRLTVL